MISKPAVSNTPMIVTSSQTVSTAGREIVSIVYYNTTAGAGRVDITDGTGNGGVVMGAAQSGSEVWSPSQPAKFDKIIVTFTTGTGIVSIQTN